MRRHDDRAPREPGLDRRRQAATVGGSRAAVGSSSSSTGAGRSSARANATRWRSPELSVSPS